MCNLFVTQSARVIHIFWGISAGMFNSQRGNAVSRVGVRGVAVQLCWHCGTRCSYLTAVGRRYALLHEQFTAEGDFRANCTAS